MDALTPVPVIRRAILGLVALLALAGGALVLWPEEGREILVAAEDLNTGSQLTMSSLRPTRAPARLAPTDALTNEAELPDIWDGPAIKAGTVITESLLHGSPAGRALPVGHVRLVVVVAAQGAPEVAPGDLVDLWAQPHDCDLTVCKASLIAQRVLVASCEVQETANWQGPATVRLEVIVRDTETDEVLGHSGAGTLSLVLRHRGAEADS